MREGARRKPVKQLLHLPDKALDAVVNKHATSRPGAGEEGRGVT